MNERNGKVIKEGDEKRNEKVMKKGDELTNGKVPMNETER